MVGIQIDRPLHVVSLVLLHISGNAIRTHTPQGELVMTLGIVTGQRRQPAVLCQVIRFDDAADSTRWDRDLNLIVHFDNHQVGLALHFARQMPSP